MKQTRLIMGMPVVIEVRDAGVTDADIIAVFDYFRAVDARFSTYKPESEISQINSGTLPAGPLSPEMQKVLQLCEVTKQQTLGYFDVTRGDKLDPSGLVKGWAINNAAQLLRQMGYHDFYVDAGGDIQTEGNSWTIGIRNPFKREENVKVLNVTNAGVATSGTAIRGQHVYNPKQPQQSLDDIVSITVIGPNIYEADRFATAAFAMQRDGVNFINSLPGLEAYMIDKDGIATYTTNFPQYTV